MTAPRRTVTVETFVQAARLASLRPADEPDRQRQLVHPSVMRLGGLATDDALDLDAHLLAQRFALRFQVQTKHRLSVARTDVAPPVAQANGNPVEPRISAPETGLSVASCGFFVSDDEVPSSPVAK